MAAVLNLTGYHLTFDDEFDSFSSSPDGSSTQWATTLWGIREMDDSSPTAGEEYFSDSTVGVNPFSDNGQVLTITAAPGTNPAGRPYNSGEINTQAMFSQTYGYFEMRAELPTGAGMWPAFWMEPEVGYSANELDIMEAFGAAYDGQGGPNSYHWDVHNPADPREVGNWVPVTPNLTTSYNTYGMLWTPTTISFYFDGQEVARQRHQPPWMSPCI